MTDEITSLATSLLAACRAKRWTLATAESCTGGLISAALTEIAGSSDVVDRAFVTYSNTAKISMIDVPPGLIAQHGAVSEPVARAMAEGALKNAGTDIAIACSGIAGPGGGTIEKPIGLVHIAVSALHQDTRHAKMLYGDIGRANVRQATVRDALSMALDAVLAAR